MATTSSAPSASVNDFTSFSSSSSSFSRRFFSRHANNASSVTLASINTVLPQYTSRADSDLPPAFDEPTSPPPCTRAEDNLPLLSSGFPISPPQSPVLPRFSPTDTNSSGYLYINPRYSTLLSAGSASSGSDPSPPTACPQSRKFEYTFPIRSNKPWASLVLFTHDGVPGNLNPAQNHPKTPRIWGGQAIEGKMLLSLDVPQVVQQITITVKGKIMTSSFEEASFPLFSHEFAIWNKSMGDPRSQSSPSSPSSPSSSRKGKFDGKLSGSYTIPFSFPFPAYVDLARRKAILPDVIRSSTTSPSPTAEGVVSLPSPPASPPTTTNAVDKGRKRRTWSFNLPSSSSRTPSSDQTTDKQNKRRSALPQQMIIGPSSAATPTMSTPPNNQTAASVAGSMNIACPTPQSFAENRMAVNVQYELSLHVVHGRFRPDSKIKTNVTYIPSTMPNPPSLRRRQAYESGGQLSPPLSDPDGWFALPKTNIHGMFGTSKKRRVEVEARLYVANPLSFTRSTPIPLYLSLSSLDSEALKTLSSPKSPSIRLTRVLRHYTPHSDTAEQEFSINHSGRGSEVSPMFVYSSTGRSGVGSELKEVRSEVASAVWWTSASSKDVIEQDETGRRWLEGEIHLPGDMQPSCACTIFSVEYYVEMLPLRSNRFEADPIASSPSSSSPSPTNSSAASTSTTPIKPRKQVLISQQVEITTLHRPDEFAPIAYSERPSSTKVRVLTVGTSSVEG